MVLNGSRRIILNSIASLAGHNSDLTRVVETLQMHAYSHRPNTNPAFSVS